MNLQYLASKLEAKMFIGVVIATTLILSLFYFFQAIHFYLNQYVNSNMLELIFFGSVLIFLSLGFYIRIRYKMNKRTLPSERSSVEHIQPSYFVSVLAVKFVQGLINGLTKPAPARNTQVGQDPRGHQDHPVIH